MPIYDQYEAYRHPLSDKDRMQLDYAARTARIKERHAGREGLQKVAGGYVDRTGEFTMDPLTERYVLLAWKYAAEQFTDWIPMPEEEQIGVRFPGVDPVGKYSVIDMEMAERGARVRATMESRSPEVRAYAQSLLDSVHDRPEVRKVYDDMIEASKRHRLLTRASKICHDANGRRLFHEDSCALMADESVEKYKKYMQGIEYAAGVLTGPVPQEVLDFYANELRMPLDTGLIRKAEELDTVPREVHVEFENLYDKILQRGFSDPENWGRRANEINWNELLTADEVDGMVSPYARATAGRVLDPLFRGAEERWNEFGFGPASLDRATHIIIDGKTVREKMYEDYIAVQGNAPREFDTFYKANYRRMTSEYVAAALMADKRVEAFVPDRAGNIPDEPMRITRTGYEPAPLEKVTLNAWQRHFAKYGFFKEKVAKAAEYQRMVEARKRVKAGNFAANLWMDSAMRSEKDTFFAQWMKTHEMPDQVCGFATSRTSLPTIAACAMAAVDYPIADIVDPAKLTKEKQAVGNAVMTRMSNGELDWVARVLFLGQQRILNYVDRSAAQLRLDDEKVLFRPENRTLFAATTVLFDANQEVRYCKEAYRAAAMMSLPEAERTPENGAKLAEETIDRGNCVGSYFNFARRSLGARCELASGALQRGDAMGALRDVVNFEEARRLYSEKMWGGGERKEPLCAMSRCFADEESLMETFGRANLVMDRDETYQKLVETLDADPEQQKIFGQGLISGKTQKRLSVVENAQVADGGEPFSFRLDAPDEKAARKKTLQDIDRKNAAKAAAPGGRAR